MRLSTHTVTARALTRAGVVTDLGEVDATLNLDESQSPYGAATLTATLLQDPVLLELTDPKVQRGLRLLIEMRESTGDPVRVREITADHGGSMSALTAAYGPAASPAKLTAQYFTSWNDVEVRPGSAIRANLLVTGRDTDHEPHRMSFTVATDEALTQSYRLVATIAETSGSLSVRNTVNYALSKIGAALLPGPVDATIAEADAIVWEPGVSAWDYIRGVAEASGLVVRCDERRRWTLTERNATLPESVELTAHTNARERVQLDGDEFADAVVIRYDWTDPLTGNRHTRYDTASDVAEPVKVIRIDRSTPFPGRGAARYWLNRLHARGRVFELEHVADYTLRPGMGFTASLPYTPAQVGWLESVTWRQPDDRGEVRTRGSADATPNAIALWPAGLTIDQLTGVINNLVTAGA